MNALRGRDLRECPPLSRALSFEPAYIAKYGQELKSDFPLPIFLLIFA